MDDVYSGRAVFGVVAHVNLCIQFLGSSSESGSCVRFYVGIHVIRPTIICCKDVPILLSSHIAKKLGALSWAIICPLVNYYVLIRVVFFCSTS